MYGHFHTDGLVHLLWEADVGWLEPLYAFVPVCDAITSANFVSTTSGHSVEQATCLWCVVKAEP